MHLQLLVVWFGYYVFLVFVSTSFGEQLVATMFTSDLSKFH